MERQDRRLAQHAADESGNEGLEVWLLDVDKLKGRPSPKLPSCGLKSEFYTRKCFPPEEDATVSWRLVHKPVGGVRHLYANSRRFEESRKILDEPADSGDS